MTFKTVNFREFSFKVPARDYIGSKVVGDGGWELEIIKYLDTIIQPDWNIIDIGANWGYHSVYFGNKLCNGQVLSFEPQSMLFNLLNINLKRNNIYNVRTVNYGVYDRRMNLWLDNLDNHIYTSYTNYGGLWASEKEIAGGEKIKTIALDQINLSKVNLLKIDAEGSELKILEGSKHTLQKLRPIIVIEISLNQDKVFNFLKDLNYTYVPFSLTEFDYVCFPS